MLVSSVALSFISFWRAAAIVLNDMASTVYYIGGISEQAIGKAAPWFVLAVMLFAYAVRSVYVESCTMFTRGGVYRVVKQAEIALFGNRLGGMTAKLSVSALMFDYILTGPISAVSAGLYLVGLINTLLPYGHVAWKLPPNFFAMLFAIIETSIVFFAGQVLETGLQDSARLLYTHQAQDAGMTAQQFKDDLCARVAVLMTCSIIGVDVKFYTAGTAITITDPIDAGGNYNPAGLGYVTAPAGSTGTIVARAFYQWPLIVTGLGYNIANIGRSGTSPKRLLAATAAFHVEP